MENITYFSSIFITYLILSMTVYSVYAGFGPESKNVRDPFEGHEEQRELKKVKYIKLNVIYDNYFKKQNI